MICVDKNDPKIKQAIKELKAFIRRRFAGTQFAVWEGTDPLGVYLDAIMDVDDLDVLYDDEEFIDLLLDIQVERYLPVYVMTRWPRERELREIEKQLADAASKPWNRNLKAEPRA
jgi:hypothetical protein